MEDNKKKNTRSIEAGKMAGSLLQGRSFLSLVFFKRYWAYILAMTVMTLMYISNKYMCQNYMKQVMDLNIELGDARTDCVNASAKYNSMLRESQMTAFIDTLHIGLTAPEQPPFKLTER